LVRLAPYFGSVSLTLFVACGVAQRLVAGFLQRRSEFASGQSMWGLWWTKRHWGRFSPSTSVSLSNHHSINFSIIIITRAGTIGHWWQQCRVDLIGLHPPLYQLKKLTLFVTGFCPCDNLSTSNNFRLLQLLLLCFICHYLLCFGIFLNRSLFCCILWAILCSLSHYFTCCRFDPILSSRTQWLYRWSAPLIVEFYLE
jgi:hypothetical protein